MSESHDNFTNLLGKLMKVSHTDLQKRIDDEKMTNDWTDDNGEKRTRRRLSRTVSRVLAVSSKTHSY
jgi:hypothetical protein